MSPLLVATTEKLTVSPLVAITLLGCVAITGGGINMSWSRTESARFAPASPTNIVEGNVSVRCAYDAQSVPLVLQYAVNASPARVSLIHASGSGTPDLSELTDHGAVAPFAVAR